MTGGAGRGKSVGRARPWIREMSAVDCLQAGVGKDGFPAVPVLLRHAGDRHKGNMPCKRRDRETRYFVPPKTPLLAA